jgi:predicted DNA-binding transcriptional regulator AlpA
MPDVSTPPTEAPAQLLDVRAVAALLHCSARHIYRMCDGGLMPRPRRLGVLCRWSRQEILDWIAEGCRPVRQTAGER